MLSAAALWSALAGMALFAASCGDDGGKGGENTPRGGDCGDDAYEVGEANHLSVQYIDIATDTYSSADGLAYSSAIYRFRVPNDAQGVHFTLEDPSGTPIWLDARVNGELIGTAYETRARAISKISVAFPEVVSFSLPNNERTVAAGACVEVKVGSLVDASETELRLSVTTNRMQNRTRLVPVNLAVPEGESSALEALQGVLGMVSDELRSVADIALRADIHSYELEGVDTALDVESSEYATAMGAFYEEDLRLNILFVERLDFGGVQDGYSLLGIAGGVPATPFSGTSGSSLVIALEPHLNASGTALIRELLVSTVAHEIGHMLGLFHTTESDGLAFDPIADTPECPYDTYDQDDDDMVTYAECIGRGADNLMFWEGSVDAPKLSATQRRVLQNAVLVQ